MRFYSPSNAGFYDDALHAELPADCIEISPEQHTALLDGLSHGKRIVQGAKGLELAAALPPAPELLAADARRRRDLLLRNSDWTALVDAPLNDLSRKAWVKYRAALRDIAIQPEFPITIDWPKAPKRTV